MPTCCALVIATTKRVVAVVLKVAAMRARRYRDAEVLTPMDAYLVSIALSAVKMVAAVVRIVVVMLASAIELRGHAVRVAHSSPVGPMTCVIH